MLTKDKYTVAIIGCGTIGFGYDQGQKSTRPRTHFAAFASSPHFTVESIVEPDRLVRNAVTKKFKVRSYKDFKMWTKVERPDVVVIASPDATHANILTALVLMGPKVVLCEKPLTLNPDETKKIVQLYKENNIGLVINYSRRFIPEYQMIEEKLAKKAFGKVQLVTIYYSRGFVHNGSHYIDLIQRLFGKPRKVIKESKRKGLPGDDTYACTFFYSSGTEIRLVGFDASSLTVNEIDIIGDRGRVQIDTDGVVTISRTRNDDKYRAFTFFSESKKLRLSNDKALKNVVENIARYLRNGTPLLSSAEDDIKNASLLSHIKKLPCLN